MKIYEKPCHTSIWVTFCHDDDDDDHDDEHDYDNKPCSLSFSGLTKCKCMHALEQWIHSTGSAAFLATSVA